tara:strand:- start:3354 stop:3728 length:375 start_codon:yes stop_codon:yes gene_type:complete
MKAEEFKQILKPLIKQTIKEVILEEGILSNIVSEVARGLTSAPVLKENKEVQDHGKKRQRYEKDREERIRRLNESVSMKADVFEGTAELPESSHSPLAGRAPDDSGVDIDGILNLANGKWKNLI